MKKKLTALALVIVMVAMLFTGLTMAYFTDNDEATNTFTVGDISIDLWETKEDGTKVDYEDEDADEGLTFENVVPGIKYHKDPTITNTSDTNSAYVRMTICFSNGVNSAFMSGHELTDFLVGISDKWTLVDENVLSGGTHLGHDNANCWSLTFDYNEELVPGADTEPLFTAFTIPADMTQEYFEAYVNNPFKIIVTAEAIQADGLTQAEAMAILDNAGAPLTAVEATVSSDAEMETALTSDAAKIVVDLTADVTYDVAAWQNEAMGGENTKVIIINGNGKTITFNHTNSDWNNIVTNGATLVIKDAKLTNAGYNDGPWNRHDLNFACDVEMENVTSDKAFAFKAGASLKNVTINDANTSDTYAIWIQPNGQTVTLEGCTIDMLACTDGRGIKIDEQYVGSPAKVTLVVKDTTFKTEEKSAILVKSVAGADITVDNIDITGVAADSTNAVWVDEASTAYADLVTVNGANKIVEP